jgi:hypothetical protein
MTYDEKCSAFLHPGAAISFGTAGKPVFSARLAGGGFMSDLKPSVLLGLPLPVEISTVWLQKVPAEHRKAIMKEAPGAALPGSRARHKPDSGS